MTFVGKYPTLDANQSPPQTLAAHLAAVLAHPETPEALFNDIADQLASMSHGVDYHTPEMIERTLTAYASRESRRKGGKR